MNNNKENTTRKDDVYEQSLADTNRAVKHAKFIQETNDMIMKAIFRKDKNDLAN